MTAIRRSAIGFLAALAVCLPACPAWAEDVVSTVIADADAYIWADGWAELLVDHGNFGAAEELRLGGMDNARKAYLHFDISVEHPLLEVTSASLRVNVKAPSYTMLKFFGIMDEAKDWDLAVLPETGPTGITWASAPQNDPTAPPVAYLPFLEEGSDPGAVTRDLGRVSSGADIDLDVTALIQWCLGRNAAFSDFVDSDNRITIAVRPDPYDYGYPDYYSREYTPEDDSDAPRLVITQLLHSGDANYDGCVDGLDYNAWSLHYLQAGGWPEGNFNGDGTVDGLDYNAWSMNYKAGCPEAIAAVPEPAGLAMIAVGGLALFRRRRH
ncbi:MAG: hypothetical protein AMJ81_13295 [Phycisphaerae bacterium SM23_33]|nr:MAG: hypothetical protein AMJ81_13295 [Phycisphaerae bacterium SM23_33]